MPISPIKHLLESLRRGGFVILADDRSRENEGDVILAAEFADRAALTFMITRARGLVCLALSEARAAELKLVPMTRSNADPYGTAFTVSVDATHTHGVTTGVSASDRAITARIGALGRSGDLTQPGHLFPVVARPGGVRERRGHTEAAVELMHLAGLRPAALIVEIIGDDGEMLRGRELERFADEQNIPFATIDTLAAYLDAL